MESCCDHNNLMEKCPKYPSLVLHTNVCMYAAAKVIAKWSWLCEEELHRQGIIEMGAWVCEWVQGKVRKKECELAGNDDVRKGRRTKPTCLRLVWAKAARKSHRSNSQVCSPPKTATSVEEESRYWFQPNQYSGRCPQKNCCSAMDCCCSHLHELQFP